MQIASLIEFLDAVADTKYIDGTFPERGGVMIVGPPGSFKTTAIETALYNHTDALVLSDLNVAQWLKLKDDFVARRYTCLGFGEFEKVYQRHPATASNLEGIIKALVSEGFGVGPNGDPRMPRIKARSCILGGITTDCFERRYNEWQKNGFLRRFIWLVVSVKNPDAIVQAIRKWQKLDFGRISYRPANKEIAMCVSQENSRIIEKVMRAQPGLHGTGYVLMKKVMAVLEWKYANSNGNGYHTNGNGNGNGHHHKKHPKRKALDLIHELSGALSDKGDVIELE